MMTRCLLWIAVPLMLVITVSLGVYFFLNPKMWIRAQVYLKEGDWEVFEDQTGLDLRDYTGPYYVWNEEGWLEKRESYLKGLLNGWQAYHTNPEAECEHYTFQKKMQDNMLHGESLIYNSTGSLVFRQVFHKGVWAGLTESFGSSGQLEYKSWEDNEESKYYFQSYYESGGIKVSFEEDRNTEYARYTGYHMNQSIRSESLFYKKMPISLKVRRGLDGAVQQIFTNDTYQIDEGDLICRNAVDVIDFIASRESSDNVKLDEMLTGQLDHKDIFGQHNFMLEAYVSEPKCQIQKGYYKGLWPLNETDILYCDGAGQALVVYSYKGYVDLLATYFDHIGDPHLFEILSQDETRLFYERDMDGGISSKLEVLNGELHGVSQYFNENGQLIECTTYDNSKCHGLSEEYNGEGRLVSKKHFKEDVLISEINLYESGRVYTKRYYGDMGHKNDWCVESFYTYGGELVYIILTEGNDTTVIYHHVDKVDRRSELEDLLKKISSLEGELMQKVGH